MKIHFFKQLKKKLKKILLFFIGDRCYSCKNQNHDYLICNQCINEKLVLMQSSNFKICTKCSCFIYIEDSQLCQSCAINKNKFFQDIIKTKSIFLYNDFLSDLIQNYKYFDKTILASFFAYITESELIKFINENKIDYIIPTPISKEKLSFRMFNQVLLILEKYENKFIKKKILYNYIFKLKDTKNQVSLNYTKRITKKHFMKINTKMKKIQNSNILIFDDVITTGSTINAIAKKLKGNNLCCFSIARTILY